MLLDRGGFAGRRRGHEYQVPSDALSHREHPRIVRIEYRMPTRLHHRRDNTARLGQLPHRHRLLRPAGELVGAVVEWPERRQAQQQDLRALAARPDPALERHLGEHGDAARDIGRRGRVADLEIVRAEPDHHQVERIVREQAREEVLPAVAPRFERVVEDRRSAAEALLDHLPAGAELGRQHAGPAHVSREAAALGGDPSPRVRVAVAEHDALAHRRNRIAFRSSARIASTRSRSCSGGSCSACR